MAEKDDMLKTLTSLKGIGKVKAEAIIKAGFDTIEKIQSASIEELSKVDGISDSVADSIKDQLPESEKKAKKPVKKPEKPTKKEKEVVEEKKQKETASQKKSELKKETKPVKKPQKKQKKKTTDSPEDYEVKKKASLPKDVYHYLAVRKQKKKVTPHFLRQEWFRYKRLPKNWHCPDGITSKMRMNKKYRPARVRVGFRGPKKVRGLHPSGFEEVLVYNVSDLEKIDADKQAARIGGTVGTKKRVAIVEKAKELDIRLLNK
ncbi:MAG: 50S ribosomal protein L32e [Candidatus Thermoplasmatota archaeon]|nr:50S ribosomal protein L32e [Candidatus Thermoplasmatota archaeon]